MLSDKNVPFLDIDNYINQGYNQTICRERQTSKGGRVMKKLLISLLLAVVLTVTFVTPAFADSEQSRMPGKAAGLGDWLGLWNALYTIIDLLPDTSRAVYVIGGNGFSGTGVINGHPPEKHSGGGGF